MPCTPSDMPKAYRFHMVSMTFHEPLEEKALPFDENLLNQLPKDDQRRLKNARASFKFTHFMDVLTEAENDEVMREQKQREEVSDWMNEWQDGWVTHSVGGRVGGGMVDRG